MDVEGGSENVVQVEASGGRESKIVAAVQMRSADYEAIIEDAVADFARNAPETRGKIYAHARSIIQRHLILMGQPESVCEVEKLALELTIEEVERRWRAQDNPRGRRIGPSVTAPRSIAARSLRRLASLTGMAVALPVIATMIFLSLRSGDAVTYMSVAGHFVERCFSVRHGEPGVTAPVVARGVSADRRSARDMTSGLGSSDAVHSPAAAAEDFAAGSAAPYAAQAPDTALVSSEAAAPSASPQTPDTAPMSSEAAAPSASPQATPAPVTRPVNAKVAALIASGKQANLDGDLDRAVRDFTEAIRIDPKYPDTYSQRGQTFFKLGDAQRAIADYSAALAHDPQFAAALRVRGMAHLYLGRTDLALADLSKAIELGESGPRLLAPIELFYARRSRGSIYESMQQYDLEIADCTALIESYAHDPVLAQALVANYGSAEAANNILARVYRLRAGAFVRRSSVERAVADLTQAIPLSSDRGYAALIDRSRLHEELGRNDLAAADARAALNIRPGSEEARLALSRLSALSSTAPPKGL